MNPNPDPAREDILRRHLWHNLARVFNGRPPAQLATADLLEIARKLGLRRIITSSSFKKLAEIQNATASGNDM
jgi:hypothetical protein